MTALPTSEFSSRTYRRASNASYIVGIAALLLGLAVGEALIGTVVYVAAFVVGVTIPRASPQPVYDERDEALAARTSDLVLTAIGFGGFAVFVSLWTLELLGRFTWSSELLSVFWAWCAFWLLWGGTYTYVRFRA
ncbi:hypothetical protein [Natrialba taiwanensis]|uniref:DUF2178 domain-containing protein n=1 Tax=Natrialba taiwanensis DSM 12281 TaxID=1230458 RepID=L9ZQW4_9EURY|nr:hypothetical protein [Natrialba taiwanensis]ELY87952.1 hypothetical protein C484_16104 [Natrialba taiwanensis DSM 12281]